jgi:hypothetical protein
VGIHIEPWQAIGIIGQACLVEALLNIVWIPNPDHSVTGAVAGINPVVLIVINPIIIPAEKDLVAFGNGEYGTVVGI